jgi:4-hydroxybenzoate polyprenyltransferase
LLVQIDGLEEDRLAKPNRPLPSGRISVENARVLYYVLFMLMWAASLYTRTTLCTLVYSIAIVVYNEGGLAKLPVLKNVIGALGLACYCWGTTVILGIESHFISLGRFPFVFKLSC